MQLSDLLRLWRAGLLVFYCVLTAAQPARGQTAARGAGAEQRAAQALDAARTNPLELRVFLRAMPKGADLHYHLSGGVYAESFIRAGAEDGLCVDPAKMAFVKPVASSTSESQAVTCERGTVAAASAFADQHLYDALIDSFSMRSFVAFAGASAHDHFFDSFGKFDELSLRHKANSLHQTPPPPTAPHQPYLRLHQ